jgi:hypothetical protein
MTIEQTVTIPADRRIFLDVPPDLPIGRAKVELTFTPLANTAPAENREKIHLTKGMIEEMRKGEDLCYLTGLLHTETSADEIRAERLKKHDHID